MGRKIFLFAMAATLSAPRAFAQFSSRFTAQGYLKQGSTALSGSYWMRFSIKKGATLTWCQVPAAQTQVAGGVFSQTLSGASNCNGLVNNLNYKTLVHNPGETFTLTVEVDTNSADSSFSTTSVATFSGIDLTPVPLAFASDSANIANSLSAIGTAGTAGQVLMMNAGATQWIASSLNVDSSGNWKTSNLTGNVSLANGGTGSSLTATNGAVCYSDNAGLNLLAPGTTGQVLTSAGTGAAPTWSTVVTANANNTFSGTNSFSALNTFTSGLTLSTAGALTLTGVNLTQTGASSLASGTGGITSGAGLTVAAGGTISSASGNLTVRSAVGGTTTVGDSSNASSAATVSAGSSAVATVSGGSIYLNSTTVNTGVNATITPKTTGALTVTGNAGTLTLGTSGQTTNLNGNVAVGTSLTLPSSTTLTKVNACSFASGTANPMASGGTCANVTASSTCSCTFNASGANVAITYCTPGAANVTCGFTGVPAATKNISCICLN